MSLCRHFKSADVLLNAFSQNQYFINRESIAANSIMTFCLHPNPFYVPWFSIEIVQIYRLRLPFTILFLFNQVLQMYLPFCGISISNAKLFSESRKEYERSRVRICNVFYKKMFNSSRR